MQQQFVVQLRFHGDLGLFVRRRRSTDPVIRTFREKTSIKDVIESCGVPHPEVDGILVNRLSVAFAFHLTSDATAEVFPFPAPAKMLRLQRRGLARFVADGHLGKLVRRLRLLGIDTCYNNIVSDAALVSTARAEERALLTRDRRLLMHAAVRDGYYPRSQLPDEQAVEVIQRFELQSALRPFTRCPTCNGLLHRAEKQDVLEQLEPLTRIYYDDFRRCSDCRQIFWPGSHFPKLQAQLRRLGVPDCDCEPKAER